MEAGPGSLAASPNCPGDESETRRSWKAVTVDSSEAGGQPHCLCWAVGFLKGNRGPHCSLFWSSLSQDKQEWRTKEVGMERRLLPGVPAALSLDSRTQSRYELRVWSLSPGSAANYLCDPRHQ